MHAIRESAVCKEPLKDFASAEAGASRPWQHAIVPAATACYSCSMGSVKIYSPAQVVQEYISRPLLLDGRKWDLPHG